MAFFKRKNKEKETHWDKAIDYEKAKLNGDTEAVTREYVVTLNTVNKVARFVDICQTSPVNVTLLEKNGAKVPGDSIMGIFAMCLLKPIRMDATGGIKALTLFVERLNYNSIDTESCGGQPAITKTAAD